MNQPTPHGASVIVLLAFVALMAAVTYFTRRSAGPPDRLIPSLVSQSPKVAGRFFLWLFLIVIPAILVMTIGAGLVDAAGHYARTSPAHHVLAGSGSILIIIALLAIVAGLVKPTLFGSPAWVTDPEGAATGDTPIASDKDLTGRIFALLQNGGAVTPHMVATALGVSPGRAARTLNWMAAQRHTLVGKRWAGVNIEWSRLPSGEYQYWLAPPPQ